MVEPNPSAEMDCSDIERSLDAWLDGELAGCDESDLTAHVASCDPCRKVAEHRRAIRDGMRACLQRTLGPASGTGRAPQALRARVEQALLRERQPWWRRALSPLPIAAAAACAMGAFLVLASHRASDPLVEEAVRRHARDLPLEVTAASTGPDSVPAWFSGKLDFNPAPPHIHHPDVRLEGARLSHISDRPAAYVRYALPRGHIGLFIIEDPDHRFGEEGRRVATGSGRIRVVSARGYNIAVWRRGEIVYSLVSDLPEAQLERIAESAVAEAR